MVAGYFVKETLLELCSRRNC